MNPRMKKAARVACLAGLLILSSAAPAQPAGPAPAAFDAPAAWASFEQLLRESYGYFDRPGIDGDAILALFAARAKAAPTDAAFIDTLQLVAQNFADPHFIVGPLDTADWAVFPTASDMVGRYDGKAFLIDDVRTGGDAATKGVAPGMAVIRIDGATPRAAIERIMGRPFADLGPLQIAHGFNVALGGLRKQPRTLELADGGRPRRFTLAATNALSQRIAEGPLLDVERRGRLGIIRINNSLGDQQLIERFSAALATLMETDALLIDLRNTPSGGNTSVARGIMGHFVDHERPYQVHVVPYESRVLGPPRRFVEYVAPFGIRYPGKVYVAGGHWTGSMGEGLMIGFDAIGATTIGTDMADLLGALGNFTLDRSAAKVDLGNEQLFTVNGLPREAYRPLVYLPRAERTAAADPVLAAIGR